MKYFYSHIIDIESILVDLNEIGLTDEQKIHLTSLVDSTIHQIVLDIILSKLSEKDRILFVNKLKADPESRELWQFISLRIENIDIEIKKAVKDLKGQLHEDIKEVKNK